MRTVKILTIVLAIILVTLVAFAGVYMQTQNRMENKVKDYALSKELDAKRVVEIKVHNHDNENEAVEETNIIEVEGEENATLDEESDENSENESENKSEEISAEDYEITKKTIENRLKYLGSQDYTIALNETDGTIRVELPENKNTDTYVYYLTAESNI